MPVYKEIPSILIQDPRAGHAYLVSAAELQPFELTASRLVELNDGVVVFTVPDDEFIEPTPPFNSTRSPQPSVLVQVPAKQTSFLLSYQELQLFRVEQPNDYGGYGISFAIPSGDELLEDLSPVQAALLQSGESSTYCRPRVLDSQPIWAAAAD